jgi:hypothetical protein
MLLGPPNVLPNGHLVSFKAVKWPKREANYSSYSSDVNNSGVVFLVLQTRLRCDD